MALDNLDLIRVTCRYLAMQGTNGAKPVDSDSPVGVPARGYVRFTPSTSLVDPVTKEVVVPSHFDAWLDAAGNIDVQLPATDDPDLDPTGWTYQVTEHVGGQTFRSYRLELPHLGGDVSLHDVVPPGPASSAGVATRYVTQAAFDAHEHDGTLDGLSDVDAATPVDGDALVWDALAATWVPGAVETGTSVHGNEAHDPDFAAAVDLTAHVGDTANPHAVTAAQAGAETPAGAQAKVDTHAGDTANPHGVTAGQAGAVPHAGGVTSVASGTRLNQPAAGTADRYYFVTDELVLERDNGTSWEQVVDAAHRGDTANPHAVTAGQAGAEPAGAVESHRAGDVHDQPQPTGASGVAVQRTTNQSIPDAVNTAVAWEETRDLDPDGYWSAVNPARLTAPSDGVYFVGGTPRMQLDAADQRVLVRWSKNGVSLNPYAETYTTAASGQFPAPHITNRVEMLAGDYLELFVFQQTGAAKNCLATGSGAWIERIGNLP